MDVFEAVQTVLAVRSYQDKPVPEDAIARIVEAAHLSASSMNGQPWHFVVVQDRETLQELGKHASHGPYIAQAAFAVAVVLEDSMYAVSDASRAIQNMVLTAWEAGVGSNWVGFFGLEENAKLLGVPDNLKLFAIVSFGYPTTDIGKGKKRRKPIGQVVHRERWETPWG